MKISRNKLLSAIAIILLVSMYASLTGAFAHNPAITITTVTYANVSPNPIGVGQSTTLVFWTNVAPPDAANNAAIRWNFTASVTDPNGAVTNLGRFVSDVNGLGSTPFTPNIVGNWMLTVVFQASNYSFSSTATQQLYTNDLFQTSTATANFTVQATPVTISNNPLPSNYWSQGVQGDWFKIVNDNFGGGTANPAQTGNHNAIALDNQTGPVTAHILWVKPVQSGGQVGGKDVGAVLGNGFYQGLAYNQRFYFNQPTMIMDGKLYYKEPLGNSGAGGNEIIVDMRSGDTIARTNVASISSGYNCNGVTCIFASANLGSPRDLNTLLPLSWTLTGVPSPSGYQTCIGSNDEYLRIYIANINTTATPGIWNLEEWNSSKVIVPGITGTVDASLAKYYDFNVTITDTSGNNWLPPPVRTTIWAFVPNDYVLVTNLTASPGGTGYGTIFNVNDTAVFDTISLKPGSVGQLTNHCLVARNDPPLSDVTPKSGIVSFGMGMRQDQFDRVTHIMPLWSIDTVQFFGVNTLTGQVWGPSTPENNMDYYACPTNTYFNRDADCINGYLIDVSWGGMIYAYNVTTGELLYTYGLAGDTINANVTSAGFYTLYNGYPCAIYEVTPVNNLIYLDVNEHSPNVPELKDSHYRCFNIVTRQEIWIESAYGGAWTTQTGQEIGGNGYLVELNAHDMLLTCIGLGPSATTIQTTNDTVTGGKMIISGTVMDTSPGTVQKDLNGRFPNGVPCVQDGDNMTAWMEYLYMHHEPRPDVLGVPVQLTLVDASGSTTDLATVTTDNTGYFSYVYTPSTAGTYTLVAAFNGSPAYAPSHAQTTFSATTPAATPTPTATPTPAGVSTDTYVLGSTAAIIVVIAIVTAVIALMLRKKP